MFRYYFGSHFLLNKQHLVKRNYNEVSDINILHEEYELHRRKGDYTDPTIKNLYARFITRAHDLKLVPTKNNFQYLQFIVRVHNE